MNKSNSTKTNATKAVTIRARAFGGTLEAIQCRVETDGSVSVYDSVAGHYTRCHSLSNRDLGRIRSAARKAA